MASTPGNYQVIARRYRPQVFADVVGQRSVVQQLHNEISDGRVGHGYLFCGPRGTGKTSMARIFAKALDCEKGPTTAPCGKCHHCLEIAAGTHLDVIEVDAATYTKAEDTKGLLEGLRRAPFSARYKIYIIDEVHMLSTHSFNALLKSLEEPPPKVVFVLATTNPEKIPETVISRCRRCNFERIAVDDITSSLAAILENEGVKIPDDQRAAVLGAVALASDGGLRDAQVLLDQLITLSAEELTLDTVRSLLGVVESDLFLRMMAALVNRDTKDCLLLVGDLVDRGRDLQRFVKMFLAFLRDSLLLAAGGSPDLLRLADSHSQELRDILDRASLPFLLNVVQQFLDLEDRMKGSAPPRFLLEFALIKLTAIDPRLVIDPELGGTKRGSVPAGKGPRAAQGGDTPAGAPRADLVPSGRAPAIAAAPMMHDSAVTREEAEGTAASVIEAIPTTDGDRWAAFLDAVALRNGMFRTVLSKARLVDAASSYLDVELAAADRAMKQHMERPEAVAMLRDAARHVWQRPLMVRFTIGSAAPAPIQEAVLDDYVVADADEAAEYVAAPPPQRAAASAPAEAEKPVAEVLTFVQALEKFPEFREACSLVESHFGAKAFSFNGIRLAEG